MANQLSNLFNEVVSVLDAMPLVNTIVLKDDNVVDVEKENVYPLVNIRFVSSPAPETDIRNYVLAFEVYNQRDDINISTPIKSPRIERFKNPVSTFAERFVSDTTSLMYCRISPSVYSFGISLKEEQAQKY